MDQKETVVGANNIGPHNIKPTQGIEATDGEAEISRLG
jgi:hypothetical protein